MSEPPLRVGVAGLGYWGPNLPRNFAALPDCELIVCCDPSPAARSRIAAMLPGVRVTDDFDSLLAVRVLQAGKHCFVEKYHPGVRRLKELAESGELGEIYYIYGNRLNLGKLRAGENALWSLGAHDVSVVLHLAGEEPTEVVGHGEAYVRPGVEDVVFCFLRFPSGLAAHLHLSWLDPHKERRFTIVGSRRMATFDDMELERKLTVYDKGFDEDARTYGEYITRSGDIFSPRISNLEPLRLECERGSGPGVG